MMKAHKIKTDLKMIGVNDEAVARWTASTHNRDEV
jgi:hypothetical protein